MAAKYGKAQVEIFWGDTPPGEDVGAPSPAPVGEMVFDPSASSANVGMLTRGGMDVPFRTPSLQQAQAVFPTNVGAQTAASGEVAGVGGIGAMNIGTGATATAADNVKARESYFTELSALRAESGGQSDFGPWGGFPNIGGLSVGGGRHARHGYGGEDEEAEPQADIPLPPHVETTGRNTKIYEIMMMTGLDQAGIGDYANAHGLSYDQAIDQLFGDYVPTEYKSPWEQHIEASGFAEGTSMEEAWASIGAGGEDQTVQLYEASPEFPEGSFEHYQHDLTEGMTVLTPAEWALERSLYQFTVDAEMTKYANEAVKEATGGGADLAEAIPLADAGASQPSSDQGYTPSVEEEEHTSISHEEEEWRAPEPQRSAPGWTDTKPGDTEATKIEKSIYATYGEDMYNPDGTIKDWAQAVIGG